MGESDSSWWVGARWVSLWWEQGSTTPVMSSSSGSSCSSCGSRWAPPSEREHTRPHIWEHPPCNVLNLVGAEESSLINWEPGNPSHSISILWEPPLMPSHQGVHSSPALPNSDIFGVYSMLHQRNAVLLLKRRLSMRKFYILQK